MAESSSPADRLYRVGVQAYQRQDRHRARTVWTQAVRLNPRHAPSWMALMQVCDTPDEQLYCLLHVRRLLPDDPRVRDVYTRFKRRYPRIQPRPLPELADQPPPASDSPRRSEPPIKTAAPAAASQKPRKLWAEQQRRQAVAARLRAAAGRLAEGDFGGALRIYQNILREDPAQPDALAGAVRLLTRERRLDEALRLTEQSIQAGNRDPGAYMSLAELRLLQGIGDPWEVLAALRRLPDVKPAHLLRAAALYEKQGQSKNALETLHEAEHRDPDHQPTLMRLAEMYDEYYQEERTRYYLQRVVDLDPRSELGRAAELRLLEYSSHVPRHVQINMLYALREVLGIVLFFFLLALLDTGVNMTRMDAGGWGGVLLSVLGGYLLVTAVSSPAQRIFALFISGDGAAEPQPPLIDQAGYLPEPVREAPLPMLPKDVRWVLGVVGSVVLLIAAWLVLRNSLISTQETLQVLSGRRLPDYLLDIFDQMESFF